MTDAVIYFNPKCGTCHKVLALLESKNIHPRKIEYLKTPPSEKEIEGLLKKLKLEPEALARKKEPVYAEKAQGHPLSRAEWIRLLHEHPILIERPVVVLGDRAIIARPSEKVLDIL